MLEVARAKAGGVPLASGSAERLPFRDGSFDIVVSTSSLHYWRAPLDALGEAHRVVSPGGSVVITDWCADFRLCRLLDPWRRRFDRAHVRAYRLAELVGLLEASGFGAVSGERYRVGWWWGMMTVRGHAQSGKRQP